MAICYTMKTINNLKKLALYRIQSGRAVEGTQASTQRPRVQDLLPSSHGESPPLPKGCDCGECWVTCTEQSMTLSTIFWAHTFTNAFSVGTRVGSLMCNMELGSYNSGCPQMTFYPRTCWAVLECNRTQLRYSLSHKFIYEKCRSTPMSE